MPGHRSFVLQVGYSNSRDLEAVIVEGLGKPTVMANCASNEGNRNGTFRERSTTQISARNSPRKGDFDKPTAARPLAITESSIQQRLIPPDRPSDRALAIEKTAVQYAVQSPSSKSLLQKSNFDKLLSAGIPCGKSSFNKSLSSPDRRPLAA
ncbi:hypothetical protein CSPX01_16148 [Colletotrichum filicis]|nr:hypothetical protein CSPX01_16148 [Colletotrichum filicis]